jgi:S-disulfanyl-L-cysteine oxidoreductase SoxD
MFRSDSLAAALALALIASASIASAADHGLGAKATPEQIAGWNIDVRPDGQGLPDGQGSVSEGETIYEAQCAACHGTFGESNEYIALSGGVGSLATSQPVRTVGSKLNFAPTLFDYINRAMPFPNSKSLTPSQVYAVASYVLNLNEIVPADFVANRESLVAVKMPNRDGFVSFPGLMSVKGKSDTNNTACMKDCEKTVEPTGELPPGFIAGMYGDIHDNFRGIASMNELAPASADLPPAVNAAPAADEPVANLIQKYGCVACHGIDKKIVGPAFRSVGERYASDHDTAAANLKKKIRSGGAGTWGSVPMPPQAGPTDAELGRIIEWVLAGAADP